MGNFLRAGWASFYEIFNFKDEKAKGRAIILGDVVLAAVYNVFITGIFYTGFLTMYGISITGTGILSFVPYLANILCIISSRILGRFQKRRKLLLVAKMVYYFLYIVVTTVMPSFVTDPGARLICFIVIIMGATLLYAPFAPGFTSWFYNFYPEDNERRTRFVIYQQIFATAMSSIILIFSSVLTDALSSSPYQNTLILAFRYLAFFFVLVDVYIQSKANEYPYPETEQANLKYLFKKIYENKKFFYCVIMLFVWNFICTMSALWDYHLLNHLQFSYTVINTMSVIFIFALMIFSAGWQKILRRYSWIKTFGIVLLCWFPSELGAGFLGRGMVLMFIILRLYQNVIQVGMNISSSNLLYTNLPEEDATAYIAIYTVGANIFAFFGVVVGTFVSSITGDQAIQILGMDVYSVQFVPMMKAFLILALGLVLVIKWRSFTHEKDIEEVLYYNAHLKKRR